MYYHGASTDTHSAIETDGDLRIWASIFHETTGSSFSTSIPVAGLWPKDASKGYVLAHESAAYAGLLAGLRA